MKAAASVLCLLLTACAAGGGGTTFKAGDVTVVDTSGLVKGVEALQAPDPSQVGAPTATKGDSLTQVDVTWMGSSCVRDWTISLSGNALDLSIQPGATDSGCQGSQAAHRVRLALNRVVEAPDIDVSLGGS